jgi:hypothetical protein
VPCQSKPYGFTAEVRVRAQVSLYGNCGGQSDTGIGPSVLSYKYHSAALPCSQAYHLGGRGVKGPLEAHLHKSLALSQQYGTNHAGRHVALIAVMLVSSADSLGAGKFSGLNSVTIRRRLSSGLLFHAVRWKFTGVSQVLAASSSGQQPTAVVCLFTVTRTRFLLGVTNPSTRKN